MPFIPLNRGAGRLFEDNLNRMLEELYSQEALAVGSYTSARDNSGTPTSAGDVVDGSSLNLSNHSGSSVGDALTGTWRCMGKTQSGTGTANDVTLWVRVS